MEGISRIEYNTEKTLPAVKVYEITSGSERNRRQQYSECKKHPGHTEFIPAKNFTMDSIPIDYRNEDVYQMCKNLIDLTCYIGVNLNDDPENRLPIGSGSVYLPKDDVRENRLCPCRDCASSPQPSNEWYVIYVTTANHVIPDDIAASRCDVILGYDDDDVDSETIINLPGFHIVNHDNDADRTIFSCITHDRSLIDRIEKTRASAKVLEEKFNKNLDHTLSQSRLVFIASHPHGLSKMISFGSVVEKQKIKDNDGVSEWSRYTYDTPTCPGSSGALVWTYGQLRVGYRDRDITTHTHSGVAENSKANTSGHGLDFIHRR